MVFNALLDPVLGPLLNLEPVWTILILSVGVSLVITLAQKFLTNQEEMKELKLKQKKFQKDIKGLQKKDPTKAMAKQKENMEVSMKYMRHSMKATLYTFIPLIIIFGWMQAHLGYDPITPGEEFQISVYMEEGLPGEIELTAVPELNIDEPTKQAAGKVTWKLSGTEGEYSLFVKYGENQYDHELLITNDNLYKSAEKKIKGAVKKIHVEMTPVKPFGGLSLLGWKPGWLGAYIILSIFSSTILRKIFQVY